MTELDLVAELEALVENLGRLVVDAGLEVEVAVTDDDRLISMTFVGHAGGPAPVRRAIGHVPGQIIRRAWSEDRPRERSRCDE